jgi:hypothetical protein
MMKSYLEIAKELCDATENEEELADAMQKSLALLLYASKKRSRKIARILRLEAEASAARADETVH